MPLFEFVMATAPIEPSAVHAMSQTKPSLTPECWKTSGPLLGDGLTTVAVKPGLGRFSARQFPAQRARELIEDGARRALADLKAVAPYDPGSPCEITVDFNTSEYVEKYRFRSGVEITGSRQIVSRGDDWWTAWKQFYF